MKATKSVNRFTAICVLTILTFVGCLCLPGCTSDPTKSAGENAATFWNSPTTQAELGVLNTIGTTALNSWIEGQINPNGAGTARRMAPETQEGAIQSAIEEAQGQCPHLSKAKIESTIRAKFATGGADKRALTRKEKAEITALASTAGVQFAASGGIDREHALALLVRRLAYKYRVKASAVRPVAEPAFNSGANGAP